MAHKCIYFQSSIFAEQCQTLIVQQTVADFLREKLSESISRHAHMANQRRPLQNVRKKSFMIGSPTRCEPHSEFNNTAKNLARRKHTPISPALFFYRGGL